MAKPSHLALVRSAEPGDPIFTVIETHRRLAAAWVAAVEREFELDGKDDAAHAVAKVVTAEVGEDLDRAAYNLVKIYPTTIRGVVTLLRYFAESAAIGDRDYWPGHDTDYDLNLARHAAAALERIARSA